MRSFRAAVCAAQGWSARAAPPKPSASSHRPAPGQDFAWVGCILLPVPNPSNWLGTWLPPRLSRSSFSCLYLYSISSAEILIGALVSKRLYIPNTNPVINSSQLGRVMSLLSFQFCPPFLFSEGSQCWDSLDESCKGSGDESAGHELSLGCRQPPRPLQGNSTMEIEVGGKKKPTKKNFLGFSSPRFPLRHWKKKEEKHSKRKRKKKRRSFPLCVPLPLDCSMKNNL